MSKAIRCERCNRRYRNQGDWNVELKGGLPVFYLCPACQTPEENTQAVIHEATLNYHHTAGGLIYGTPKVD